MHFFRYLYGDYVNICQCVPGYRGSMCEQKINGLHPSGKYSFQFIILK